ncbi:polysaccharide deacetylase family protein [Mucilaginibacter sp. HMF5004]|uniref:polysaccharide deacetylase family protein n=1 Tax=Mucilaginibacter rivuli TaxID=2857527 RepID=UPI001C5CDC18|nr:polysaccharide deacetylase family protein [Mucilaginibacter rivuli]MBW4890063.1 polysaccharide deacetylase family protein [Mucilaginibacter rivuli]
MNKILNFHLVNDMAWFEKTIILIKSKYNMVSIDTLDEYYQGKIKLKNACHITVDDGDETFYRIIYPVLKKHNIPASLYVSPKIFNEQINYWFQEIEGYDFDIVKKIVAEMTNTPVDKLAPYSVWDIMKVMQVSTIHDILTEYRKRTNTPLKPYQNMSIAELREVDQQGLVTIGGHTMNHPILMNESDESSHYEISNSINELAKLLGHPVKCFSYPNGIPGYDFTDRECDTLKRNGITLTFSTEARDFSDKDNVYKIPRIGVSNSEGQLFLKAKLFLGPVWLILKKLKPSGEYVNRVQIKKIIGNQ